MFCLYGCVRGDSGLALDRVVVFSALLQKEGRFQVPVLVRWQFKMDCVQVLWVRVRCEDPYSGAECFYGKMRRDGRFQVLKLTRELLEGKAGNLVGRVLKVELGPADI